MSGIKTGEKGEKGKRRKGKNPSFLLPPVLLLKAGGAALSRYGPALITL